MLCTSSSWHHQIAVRTKSWAYSFCPLYMFLVAFFLALRELSSRAASAARGAEPLYALPLYSLRLALHGQITSPCLYYSVSLSRSL